jgi:hypothetical protein
MYFALSWGDEFVLENRSATQEAMLRDSPDLTVRVFLPAKALWYWLFGHLKVQGHLEVYR